VLQGGNTATLQGTLAKRDRLEKWIVQLHSTGRKVCEAVRSRKVLQGGHAATLQRTLGKRDCSQNDKMDRGGMCEAVALSVVGGEEGT
jgi:hypothetical protein